MASESSAAFNDQVKGKSLNYPFVQSTFVSLLQILLCWQAMTPPCMQ